MAENGWWGTDKMPQGNAAQTQTWARAPQAGSPRQSWHKDGMT